MIMSFDSKLPDGLVGVGLVGLVVGLVAGIGSEITNCKINGQFWHRH